MLDVSGFTPLTERLSHVGDEGSEWLSDILHGLFAPLLTEYRAWGGDVVAFGGDAMLVLYTGPAHAERAVASLLALLRWVESSPPIRFGKRSVHLGVSAGAHSGDFLLTRIGADKCDVLLLGSDADRTARAEKAAAAGELVVTASVVDSLGDAVDPERRGEFFRLAHTTLGRRSMPTPGRRDNCDPELLRPFVPPQTRTSTAGGVLAVEESHRPVSVAFVGMPGTSDAIRGGEPRRVSIEIAEAATGICALAEELGGSLISTDVSPDGPTLLLAFGAPVAHEHDLANSLHFAQRVRDVGSGRGLRIGIAHGHVFAGEIGAEWRRQYTILGDTVNLAARLMSAAAPGETLVAADTAEQVSLASRTTQARTLKLKGRRGPQRAAVLGPEATPVAPLATVGTALVGRASEMAAIDRALEAAEATATHTLLLRGEPGVGKTRLAEEALAHALSRGWAVHSGAAFTHTTNRPFSAWRPIMRGLLGDDPLADRHARANAVSATVARLSPVRAEHAPLLGPVLDIEMPPTEATRALRPEAARRLLLTLLVELVDAAAAERPRLLFIDDVHWADPSSAELIERLTATASRAPVLLLMTSRKEGRRLTLPEDAVVLAVGELPRGEAEDLALALLREQHVGADIQRLLDSAGGNPLFISHVVDAIRPARPGAPPAAGGLAVPRRLEGLLGNRIDQLEPQARELLRLASCVGPEFSAEQIAALDRRTHVDSVDSMLCEQTRTGMLREIEPGRRTYRFSHGLVQQAAYEGMRFSRRRQLQTRVGTWIEQRNAEKPDAVLEELAYHFSQSDDIDRGRSYCVRAAEKLVSTFAYQESLGFYRMALDLTRARTAEAAVWRARVLERIGWILYEMMLDDEAARACKRALAILRRIPTASTPPASFPQVPTDWPEVPLEARLAYRIGHAALQPQQGARWLRRAADTAPRGLVRFRAEVLRVGGFTLGQAGRLEDARKWSRHAVVLAHRSGDTKLVGRCHLNVFLTNSILGCHRDTVGALASAIEAYRTSDSERARPSIETDSTGQPTPSTRSRLRALMVEPDLFAAAAWWGTPSVEAVEINIGYAAAAIGEFDIAEELWLSALERLERHGANRDSMETYYANIGASELWQGRQPSRVAPAPPGQRRSASRRGDALRAGQWPGRVRLRRRSGAGTDPPGAGRGGACPRARSPRAHTDGAAGMAHAAPRGPAHDGACRAGPRAARRG